MSNSKLVSIKANQTLIKKSEVISHVYFPSTTIFSSLATTASGDTFEVFSVGSEGLIGLPLLLGNNISNCEIIALQPGYATQFSASFIKQEFYANPVFQELVLRYTDAILLHITQVSICNKLHSLDEQICRWLLLYYGRIQSLDVKITQDALATLLGVRRERLSFAFARLKAIGLLSFKRGSIFICDTSALKNYACDCFSLISNAYSTDC